MKKVVVVSFFKSNNLGDIKISEAIVNLIEKRDLSLVKYDFLEVERINNYDTIHESEKNVVYMPDQRLKKIVKNIFAEIISIKYLVKKKNSFSQFEKDLVDADALIIGGGNMFMDISSVWPMLIDKYIQIAKKHKKKVIVTSVGVGPIKHKYNIKYIKRIVSNSDYFSVRDEKSLMLIKSIYGNDIKKIELTRDPVFDFSKTSLTEDRINKVGICILGESCFPQKELYDIYLRQILKVISFLNNKQIILFSTEKSDYASIKEVARKIDHNLSLNYTISYIDNFKDLEETYYGMDFLIGGRMHAMIFAHIKNTPHFGFNWQSKILGYSQFTNIRMFEISSSNRILEDIVEHMQFLTNNRENEVEKIVEKNIKISNVIKSEFDAIKFNI